MWDVGMEYVANGNACYGCKHYCPKVEAKVLYTCYSPINLWNIMFYEGCKEEWKKKNLDSLIENDEGCGNECEVCLFLYEREKQRHGEYGYHITQERVSSHLSKVSSKLVRHNGSRYGRRTDYADEHTFNKNLHLAFQAESEDSINASYGHEQLCDYYCQVPFPNANLVIVELEEGYKEDYGHSPWQEVRNYGIKYISCLVQKGQIIEEQVY